METRVELRLRGSCQQRYLIPPDHGALTALVPSSIVDYSLPVPESALGLDPSALPDWEGSR